MLLKKIGILGGMGPEASANFYQKIIEVSQKKYGAVQDTDYPPMVIYSLPLKGFDESGIVDKELVLEQLFQGIKLLNDSGCKLIVMICNTVHSFIDKLQLKSNAPILSMIEEVANVVLNDQVKSVGVLASETTFDLKLYDSSLSKKGITPIVPNLTMRKNITQLILGVMSGKVDFETKKKLIQYINNLPVEAVILGCTELPLVIHKDDFNIKVYDSTEILAESVLNYSHGKR
jgi:aspartate racemase